MTSERHGTWLESEAARPDIGPFDSEISAEEALSELGLESGQWRVVSHETGIEDEQQPVVYMVTQGDYDDYRVVVVCGDSECAQANADAMNRDTERTLFASVEPVGFIPPAGDARTREVARQLAAALTVPDTGQDRGRMLEELNRRVIAVQAALGYMAEGGQPDRHLEALRADLRDTLTGRIQ